MTDDDDVTIPGDHEVIAELRRRAAIPPQPPEDESDDDITLAAEPAVIAEIRAAAATESAEPEAAPLPPPQLGTLPPPEGQPVALVPAAEEPAGARWQPTGRLPVAQRVETGPASGPRPGRTRWVIGLVVVAAALVAAAVFSLRDDGDDGPTPATTEVVTTTSAP